MFRNRFIFYGDRLLASPPTPSWSSASCHLSAAALFNVFVASGRPSIRNHTMRHAVVLRHPPNMGSTKVQIKLDIGVVSYPMTGKQQFVFLPVSKKVVSCETSCSV
jgi:hypothetical protein